MGGGGGVEGERERKGEIGEGLGGVNGINGDMCLVEQEVGLLPDGGGG